MAREPRTPEPPDLPNAEGWRRHDESISLRPIGYIIGPHERPDDTPIQSPRNPDEHARVVVFPELAEGLDGLAEFDYVWLLTYLDRAPPDPGLRVVPFLLRESGQRVGAFATRYPGRPNPLALSLVRVLSVQDRVLRFAGLDLCHRTPVLDIKPWEQHLDIPGCQPGLPQLDRIRGGWYHSTGAAHTNQRFPNPRQVLDHHPAAGDEEEG